MLDRGGDDVAAARSGQRSPHRGVHRFGAGGGEHDLARACAEACRHLLASLLDRDARRVPLGVQPTRVGVVVAQVGEHRLERDRAERRGGRVIEVRASHVGPRGQTRATQ